MTSTGKDRGMHGRHGVGPDCALLTLDVDVDVDVVVVVMGGPGMRAKRSMPLVSTVGPAGAGTTAMGLGRDAGGETTEICGGGGATPWSTVGTRSRFRADG